MMAKYPSDKSMVIFLWSQQKPLNLHQVSMQFKFLNNYKKFLLEVKKFASSKLQNCTVLYRVIQTFFLFLNPFLSQIVILLEIHLLQGISSHKRQMYCYFYLSFWDRWQVFRFPPKLWESSELMWNKIKCNNHLRGIWLEK